MTTNFDNTWKDTMYFNVDYYIDNKHKLRQKIPRYFTSQMKFSLIKNNNDTKMLGNQYIVSHNKYGESGTYFIGYNEFQSYELIPQYASYFREQLFFFGGFTLWGLIVLIHIIYKR